MKNIFLIALIAITCNIIYAKPLNKKYTKNVWREIEAKIDSTLFIPTFDRNSYEWEAFGIDDFDIDKYNDYFNNCSKNLWNIIHRQIVYNELKIYTPYNPMWIDEIDDGFFRFQLVSDDSGNNSDFINNHSFRKKLIYWNVLGYEMVGIPEAIGSISYPGEDSIASDGSVVYYPFPKLFYNENDIIKYRVREECEFNKNGELKNRLLKGIAPVVYKKDFSGKIIGEQILFWFKFEALVPVLKKHYLLVDQGKKPRVMSYYKYFINRYFSSKIVKQESIYLSEK